MKYTFQNSWTSISALFSIKDEINCNFYFQGELIGKCNVTTWRYSSSSVREHFGNHRHSHIWQNVIKMNLTETGSEHVKLCEMVWTCRIINRCVRCYPTCFVHGICMQHLERPFYQCMNLCEEHLNWSQW